MRNPHWALKLHPIREYLQLAHKGHKLGLLLRYLVSKSTWDPCTHIHILQLAHLLLLLVWSSLSDVHSVDCEIETLARRLRHLLLPDHPYHSPETLTVGLMIRNNIDQETPHKVCLLLQSLPRLLQARYSLLLQFLPWLHRGWATTP